MGNTRLRRLLLSLHLPRQLLLMRWQVQLQLQTLKRPLLAGELQGELGDQIMAARGRRADGQEQQSRHHAGR